MDGNYVLLWVLCVLSNSLAMKLSNEFLKDHASESTSVIQNDSGDGANAMPGIAGQPWLRTRHPLVSCT